MGYRISELCPIYSCVPGPSQQLPWIIAGSVLKVILYPSPNHAPLPQELEGEVSGAFERGEVVWIGWNVPQIETHELPWGINFKDGWIWKRDLLTSEIQGFY